MKLYYTDPNNKDKTLTKETDENKEAVFTATWKNMVKPNTTMYAQIGDGDKIALKLGIVQGVAQEPITALDNLSSVFNGLGLTFTIPGSKFKKPMGGMTFSINPPWEKFLQISVVGNLDGSFVAYVGGARVGFDADSFRTKWKSTDQDALDQRLTGIEKTHFAEMRDATQNEINRQYTSKPGHSFPVLGKFTMSLSLGIGYLGRYRSAGAKDNYQYSFQVFLAGTVNFDAGWQIFFCAAPPVYLDIHIQLSVMMSIRFAFYCNQDHSKVKDVKADWGAWGISITVRLTLTIGLSLGLPGILSVTIGGYCWIQITFSAPFGGGSRIEGLVSAGGGVFLEIKIFFFKYRWNVVDSGEIVIWRFPKERGGAPLV